MVSEYFLEEFVLSRIVDFFLILHYFVTNKAVYKDIIRPTQKYVAKMGQKLNRDLRKAYTEDPKLFKNSFTMFLHKLLVIFFVIMHFKRVDSHRYPKLSIFDI